MTQIHTDSEIRQDCEPGIPAEQPASHSVIQLVSRSTNVLEAICISQ